MSPGTSPVHSSGGPTTPKPSLPAFRPAGSASRPSRPSPWHEYSRRGAGSAEGSRRKPRPSPSSPCPGSRHGTDGSAACVTRTVAALVEIHHGWESGMDNSPRWDEAYAAITVEAPVQLHRHDTRLVTDSSQRPTDSEYQRYLHLVAQMRSVRYRDADIPA